MSLAMSGTRRTRARGSLLRRRGGRLFAIDKLTHRACCPRPPCSRTSLTAILAHGVAEAPPRAARRSGRCRAAGQDGEPGRRCPGPPRKPGPTGPPRGRQGIPVRDVWRRAGQRDHRHELASRPIYPGTSLSRVRRPPGPTRASRWPSNARGSGAIFTGSGDVAKPCRPSLQIPAFQGGATRFSGTHATLQAPPDTPHDIDGTLLPNWALQTDAEEAKASPCSAISKAGRRLQP
jgi:hypothetical protein